MPLENSEHRTGRQPSGNGATRICQTSRRVPWIRLAGCIGTAVAVLGLAGWLPVSFAAEAPNPGQQVAAHLEAGEYGAALDIATQTANAEEKAALIEQVADAQLQAGDTKAVEASARRLPAGPKRERLQQAARGQKSAGGGNLANPGPLMMMIQQLTGGPPDSPWMEADGEGGAISWEQNGVWVDPQGVLTRRLTADQQGHLVTLGLKSRNAAINQDMAAPSALRFVSLARLEKAVADRVDSNLPLLETMRHMAGLSHIQYVIAVPEEHDVLLAGPAEGWKFNEKGTAVGVTNGHPTLHLDDLVTVMRTFSKNGDKIFGCSINPRKEGLKAVKDYVEASQKAGPLAPGGMKNFLGDIQKRMGQQDVEIYGIPANSRVARVLVAADYRMKLIGIGKLEGGQAIPSIFELLPKFANHEAMPLDALRWWLTMKYDSILHSPDRMVYEIRGSSVRVLSEDQVVQADGTRIHTGKASPVNQLFAKNFTDNYAELAKQDLVFAELQNVFDLGMVAALLQTEHLAQRANLNFGAFAENGAYKTKTVAPAKTVESVINHRVYRGNDIVVQVAGGVRADILSVARQTELHREEAGLKEVPAKAKPGKLPEGRWWWDAK
jgi:hypothetical protein